MERWNPWARKRVDLFGIADLLAVSAGRTLAVQTTTAGNVAARIKKIQKSDILPTLIAAGWKVAVHGWRKPTRKKRKWTVRVVYIGVAGSITEENP